MLHVNFASSPILVSTLGPIGSESPEVGHVGDPYASLRQNDSHTASQLRILEQALNERDDMGVTVLRDSPRQEGFAGTYLSVWPTAEEMPPTFEEQIFTFISQTEGVQPNLFTIEPRPAEETIIIKIRLSPGPIR